MLSNKDRYWTNKSGLKDLKQFSNDFTKIVSVIITPVKSSDWSAKDVRVTAVEDGHRPIMGRDLFLQLGFSVTQSRQIININQNCCPIRQRKALDFRGLISRNGKTHKHTVKSTFHKSLTSTHQKEGRTSINLQRLVNADF